MVGGRNRQSAAVRVEIEVELGVGVHRASGYITGHEQQYSTLGEALHGHESIYAAKWQKKNPLRGREENSPVKLPLHSLVLLAFRGDEGVHTWIRTQDFGGTHRIYAKRLALVNRMERRPATTSTILLPVILTA